MKKLLLFAAFLGLITFSYGQVSLYTFNQTVATYTPITGGTVLGIPNNDDTNFPDNPIGFTFWYNGAAYTRFSVNSNGFIALGSAIVSSYTSLSTGTSNNVISGLNQDIQGDATISTLRYETIGVAPNRTLVVQWTAYDDYQSVVNLDSYDFQIRLSETTNNVDVVYGTMIKDASTDDFFQVGLRGNTNADFNNREVSTALLNTWATSNAGVTNAATCEMNTSLLPTSGQTYSWSAIPPAPPTTLTFTGVTSTAMTLNWVDNSTNETSFQVFRSLDGINYTFAGTVASASTATTGTPYNLAQTGLFSNTLYYWQVYAVANVPSTPLSGTQATLPGTLCGTYTVGPTGAYTSLTAAIADAQLNGLLCPCNFELQATYVSTVETFPLNVPFVGSGSGTSITVRPELGATNLSITTGATNTVVFNGATYFSFDGRPGGVGTTSQLTIANTGTAFSAINYTGDGQNTGANYVTIQGISTGLTNGVVSLASNTTITGKTGLFINNSRFIEGASNPQQYIFSTNATANSWNEMTLNNNTFEDWFSATAATNAINIAAGNRGWTITNNEFYQTAARTATTGNTHNIVLISTTTAASGGNNISNNRFGGTDSLMTGNYTFGGAVANRFNVINATGNTSFANNTISNNIIKNFNFSTTNGATTSPGMFSGIVAAGTTNNFNITNNIIGSTTNSDSIVVTTTTSGGIVYGITCTATGNNVITGNQVGSFKILGSLPTVSTSFVGLNISAGANNTITNNLVGSTTVNSSVRTHLSAGATAGRIDGIFVGGTIHTVTNNTVAGLTSFYGGTATGAVRGIFINTGAANVTGNTVNNLATLANYAGSGSTLSMVGIYNFAFTNGQVISNNTISNLYNFANSATNTVVTGIGYNTTATLGADNLIHRNRISNLGAPLSTGSPIVTGIDIQIGNVRTYNNFVDLGLDGLSAPITAPNGFVGINKSTTANGRFLFNSVRIAGTGVNGGATNSFAFRRTAVGAADTVKANVFTNFRSNGTSTGTHYAISLNNNTTLSSDRNVFFGNGTGYVFGSYNAANVVSLTAWTVASAGDANSFFANPNFVSATDLHINGATPNIVESRAVTVTSIPVDIDLDARPGPTGSVNGGGTDPDIGADEVDAVPVTTDIGISALFKPSATGCHTSTDSVIVTLRNYGTSTIDFALDNVTINASVTGPNPVVFGTVVLNSGTLAGSATMNVVMGINYDMTALGTYTFNASATTPLDFINSNDAMAPVAINVAGGTVLANQQAICAGANVTLTNTGATIGGTFQWEISQNGSVWANIPAATSNPYVYTDASTGPDTLYFKSTSCGLHTSTTIDTVIINYVVAGVGFDTTRCGPGLLDLHATGAGLITWYDAAVGGSALDTGVVYTPFLNQTDTFYVETSTGTAAGLYTSTFAAGNGSSGNMFAITAINTITITSFDGHVTSGTSNWRIDYRPDNIHLVPGSNTSAAGWTLIGTATGVPAGGTGLPTPIPIPVNITIPAGQTFSFHVMTTGGSGVQYTNGTLTGSPFSSNADLTLLQGFGGTSFNCTFNPRVFNGRVHYSAGCASATRDTVIATVTPPPAINITSSSGTAICSGTSFDNNSIFNVISVDTNYTYNWTPVTGLSSATGATVTATPSTTTTYIVNANNAITGCANYDTVSLAVSLAPQFTATVNEDTICDGAIPVVLNASFGSLNDTIGFGTVQNSTTSYPTPYGNFYWGARHQFLITAADLASFGVTAGNITGLAFDVVTPSGTPLIDFEIQMAPTALTDLGTVWETTGFTVVLPADTVTPVAGWNIHNFTNNFTWDGVSNIVVQTCFNNASFIDNDIVNQTTTSYVASRWFRQDALGTCPNPSVTGTASQRPNMVFYKTANFTNAWSPTATIVDPDSLTTDASPLVTTDYVFTSLDTISGCFNYDTARVTVLAPFAVNGYVTPTISCFGGTDTLVANASGGYGNYSYLWSDALGTGDSASVTGLPFDYTVGVTVTDGCGSLTDSITIDIADPMSVTSTDTANCGPGTGFVLSSTVTGGNGVNSYSWTGGSTSSTSTTGLVSTTTNYTVTVTDGCGTTATSVSTVTINTPPTVNLGPDVIQPNPPATLDAGAGFSSYLWSTSATTQTINVTTNGTYTVTVTDGNGCTGTDNIQVNFTAGINNPDGSTATVSYYPNPTNGVLNMMIEGFMGKELKMEVMDIEGRVIRNYVFAEVTETYTSQIDLTTLRAGTYLVVLHTATDSYTHRIVITTNY